MRALATGRVAALGGLVALAACAGPPPVPGTADNVTVRSALTTVVVTVTNTSGAAQSGVLVYAQKNGTFTQTRTTNGSGVASFSLGSGNFRFATPGSPSDYYFFSGAPGSCPMPSCTSAAITVTTPVQVTVVDTTGAPQADAHVLSEDTQGNFENYNYTNASGQAPVSVPPGTYKFVVPGSGQGFFFRGPNCTVPGCTATTVTITHPVTITVVNGAGVPLPDQVVLAEDPNGEYWNIDYTNAQGQVQLSVDPGAYRFVVPDGPVLFPSGAHGSCVVPGCTTATIVIPDPVVVTVVDGAGQPIANQTVKAQLGSGEPFAPVETDASGHASFTLPLGAWRFRAACDADVFYSGAQGSCVIPGCTTAAITMICGGCAGQPNGTACNDANACTQTDTCQTGACVGGNPVTCSAQDQCHDAGTCNPSTGACSNPAKADGTACSDGNACTQTDACQSGMCTGANPVTCNPQDQCHDAGTCNPSTGTCSNPPKANGASCSDSDGCTQTDTCQSGACTGSNPVTCTAQDQCHDAGTCSPSTGACSNPAKANGSACNDSDGCTQTDTCQSGACTGSNPVTCTAQDQCHDAGTCSPSTGACSNPAKANGTACSDGNACTQTDTCQSGACTGSNPVTCTAQDQCHDAGTCNTSTGICSNPSKANGASCSDGDSCTSPDACQAGVCTAGAPSCAPIVVTNDIIHNRAIPQLGATLLADRTKVAAGDGVTFTSMISNTGAKLETEWVVNVQNVSASPFIVQGWQLAYEYQAVPSGQWTPFARVRFDANQTQIPETTLVPINFKFVSPGGVSGTSIAPGGTANWWIEIIPVMPPDVLGVIFDPADSSGIRLVARFDVPSGPPQVDAMPLSYPSLNLEIDNISAQFDFWLLTVVGQVPASGLLTPSGSGPLASGASRIYTGTFIAPFIPPFPLTPGETEAEYRNRIQFATLGYRSQVVVTGQATPVNPPFVPTVLDLPLELPLLLNMQKTGPAAVNAGFATTYALTLPNSGNGVASALTIADAIDGQPVAIGNLSAPTSIAAGATGAATFTARSALERPPGPMTDFASLTWQDRNGHVYGPISASFTNSSTPGHPEGYLSLTAPASDLPHLVGTTQALTVTALDPYGSPVSGVSVHFTVSGPHPQTADIVTGANGKATLEYAGATIGVDRVVASGTITTTSVTTNTLEIQWATAVGTPCTGRATPLDVMLVVDVSGSMALEPPYSVGSATSGKLEAARVAANRFIDNLSPTRDQVGLVVFRARVDSFAALSSDSTDAKATLAGGIELGIYCATNMCDPGAAGSDLAAGLDRALDELESPRHRAEATKVVVYIGDGGIGADPASEIARLHASGAKAVVLAVGSVIEGGSVARQLASTINDYFYSPGPAGIDYAFNSLNQDLCRNRAPLVSAGGDQGLYNVRLPSSLPLLGEVHDDGAGNDPRLTSEWTVISGPGAVTFVDPTSPVTDVLFFEPGTYVLQLAASDGYLTVADRATITVDPDPSIVGASLAVALSAPGPLETGQTEVLTATLLDGLGAPIRDFVVTATVAGANPVETTLLTNNNGVAVLTYQGAKPGTDVIRATAIGSTLHLDSATVSVQWVAPATGGPMLTQGWIGAPLHQSTVMERVPIVLAPDVTLASGTVKYAPTSNPTDIHTVATGVSGGPGSTLATFDTTLVPNDTYVIELAGTSQAGNQKTSTVLVTVTGDYKPGRVVVELTDFTVPIAGLPITIGRRYDSLEKDKVGDFGHGWSLAVGHPRVETNPDFSVSVTLPNGRRATFGLQIAMTPAQIVAGALNPFPGVYLTSYQAEPGVFGTLTQEGGCPAVRYNPNNPDNPIPCFFTFGFVPDNRYAPEHFTYTDPYGTAYRMAASGKLESITDRQGNTLSFQPNGIISSTGKSVTFVRDAEGRITRVIYTPFFGDFNDAAQYTYDAAGDLTTVNLSPGGFSRIWQHTYDGQHRLLTSTDPRGNPARTSTYDAAGRLATDKDALNRITSYAYNLGTRTNTTTFPDTGVVTQTFDARGLVLSETNPLGHTTTHEYDANRNETKKTNAVGEVTTATYDTRGNQTSVTDPTGTTETTYNDRNLPTAFEDRLGHVTTIDYDDRHVPSRFADELGTRFKFTNSEQGLPLVVEDAAGKRAYVEYDAAGNVSGRTDWLGRITRTIYDQAGHPISETTARGGVTTYNYTPAGDRQLTRDANNYERFTGHDPNGNLFLEYDNMGRGTNSGYDPLNYLTAQVRFPDGSTVGYTRDFRGNPLTMTDEGGRTTTYEYDLAGQLVKTTYADTTFTTRTYDPLGRVATTTDERGNTTTYAYDPGCGCSDRVTSVTDPLGHTTTTAYDANGRRSSVTDANNHTTSFVYDVRGHVIETHYADGTVMYEGYDARGRRTSMTDQTGAITLYGYDDQGQLTSVTDPLDNVTAYAYDLDGNLASVTDANGHTTAYEYDLLKRKTKRTMPMGQFETFAYDMASRQTGHTDFRGKTTTMTYDPRDRMLTKVPDSSLGEASHTYTYSATGMRLTATNGTGTTTHTYDLRDRLLTKATPPGTAGTLAYTYDAAGNVATIRSSNTNGTSVDYAWDAANQLASIADNRVGGTTTAAYTPTNRPSTWAQPNGIGLTYSYDALDRVTSMLWRQGTSPAFGSWAYTHNLRGQRLTSTDITGRAATYTYDSASRLASETVTGDPHGATFNGALSYSLDGAGNRLSRASTLAAIASGTHSYNANDEVGSDTYDLNGNTLSADGHTYAYDFENRLVSKNAGAVTVTYDCDGNRVAKTVGGVTTRYLVDDLNPTGYLQVLDEIVGSAVQTRYTYGTSLVSQTRDVSTAPIANYYGFDGHGNITFLTDAAGAVVASYDYDAWGNVVASTGNTLNTRLYTGEEFDPDLGLLNLRARQYRPGTGRFLTLDPLMGFLSEPVSFNRYLYGGADPIGRIDRSGKSAWEYAQMAALLTLPFTAVVPYKVSIGNPKYGTITIDTSVFGALVFKTFCVALAVVNEIALITGGVDVPPPWPWTYCRFDSTLIPPRQW